MRRRRALLPLSLWCAAALVASACATPAAERPPPPPPPPPESFPPIIVKKAPGSDEAPRLDDPAPVRAPSDAEDVDGDRAPGPAPDPARAERAAAAPDEDARAPGPLPPRPARLDPARTMTVHALDVGQGSATLIELPCGAILVDTGGELNERFDGTKALVDQLEAFFARRKDLDQTLDLLVVTHPHIDHVRGVPALLQRFKVRNVVDNGRQGDETVAAPMATLRDFLASSRGKVGYRAVRTAALPKQGLGDDVVDPLRCRPVDPRVRVLSGAVDGDPGWGTSRYGHRHADNENNHSVVLRVDFGESSLLITGDLEEHAIEDLVERYQGTRALDVDVYAVGHHGSYNGTTRSLMAAMTPDVALISMGPASREIEWTAWQYGHPRQKVVDMLEGGVRMKRAKVDVDVGTGQRRFTRVRLDRAVYGTGWDGAIAVDMTADGRVFVRSGADAR